MKKQSKTSRSKQTFSQKQGTRKTVKSSSKRSNLHLLVGGVLLVSLAFLVSSILKDSNNNLLQAKSYLINDNAAACVIVDAAELECENLQSGEIQRFAIPKRYNDLIEVTASPDGQKLVVWTSDGKVVVTDNSFNEIRRVTANRGEQEHYAWASGSEKLLISEIKREKNDADFLPKPFVVTMLDIATGEKRTVYKTGEQADIEIEGMNVLGGNNEHIYISLPTSKNWVAKETVNPFETIHAIRLSDGFVQPINTYQVSSTFKSECLISYDSARNLFVFIGQLYRSDDAFEDHAVIAEVEFGVFGPTLRKVHASVSKPNNRFAPMFTNKGMAMEDVENPAVSYNLIDDGTITPLELSWSSNSTLLSLRSMPNLPQSK